MGIIAKQSIKNTIYSYSGIAIGIIYSIFLVPKIFDANPGEWGLVQLIISYVQILLSFALLGLPNVIVKYWPGLKQNEQQEFIPFVYFTGLIGWVLLSSLFFIFQDTILKNNSDQNLLLKQYLPYTVIFLIFQIVFYISLNYCRVLFKTTIPTGLKDSFIKLYTFILIITYSSSLLSYQHFFLLYLFGYSLQMILIVIYAVKISSVKLRISLNFFRNPKLKEILLYGGFSLLAGGTVMIVQRVDIVMIGSLLSLNHVAYYATAYFFMTAILVPSRSVVTIAAPLISHNIQKNNYHELKKIYLLSSLNMFIFSTYVFLGIWICVDELMVILGEKFGQIKWVILLLGIGKLIEILNGLNQNILLYSKYYKWDSVFQIILLVLTVLTNLLLIPRFGINGAALATLIAIFINQALKALLIYKKYGLHPYNSKSLFIISLLMIVIIFSGLIPIIISPLLSILFKAVLFSILYFSILYILNLSPDVNTIINKYLRK